jgi:hypothetical protein
VDEFYYPPGPGSSVGWDPETDEQLPVDVVILTSTAVPLARTGWQVAMGRIGAEFDIPQNDASLLARKIAENEFQLPPAYRAHCHHLPDEVIVRIESIVRDAYLEAGEVSPEQLWAQVLVGRRALIAKGELLTPVDFKKRMRVSEKRLARLADEGSVFALEVDESEYFPALLTDPNLDQERLQAICRIIQPAPADSRLDFLTSQDGCLDDRRPLDMLESDEDFKSLKRVATGWAAAWWRTAVTLYQGEHEVEPEDVEPLYTAAVEVDPRRPLWDRASEALQVHGYQWPLGPYPAVREFTLFVERQPAGDAAPTPEACVQIIVDGEYIRVRIVAAPGTALDSETVAAGKHKTFIEVAKQVIAHLCKH